MLRSFTAMAIGLVLLTGCQSTKLDSISSPVPYAPISSFKDKCDPDPDTPKEWAAVANLPGCTNPFRIVSKTLPHQEPSTELSPVGDFLNVDDCKIRDTGSTGDSRYIGFPGTPAKQKFFSDRRYPTAKTVFQIVPIASSDAPAANQTPDGDYGNYFAWIKNYLTYISDFGGVIEFRVPEDYIQITKPFAPFKVGPQSHDFDTFARYVTGQVDSKIDFSGANVVLFVAPLGTNPDVFGRQRFNSIKTNEGNVFVVGTAYPSVTAGNIYDSGPVWWLHELYHAGVDLGDGFGDEKFQGGANRGMGEWGLMSTGKTEFLTWHKWLLGFSDDRQVACLDKSKLSTTWIVPSSYKSKKIKLAVIPLNVNKALVVESIRAAGLNFKVGAEAQGALVYVVDAADRRPNYGFTVLSVEGKTGYQGNYYDPKNTKYNSQNVAPLYKGESVIYEGVKITNVEWGEFGDVIKVEPVK